AGLRQRKSILIQLSKQHDERRRALVDALGDLGYGEPRYLADLASPADGFEDAIDHFLGDLADAVVLDSGDLATGLDIADGLSKANFSGTFVRPLADGPAAEPLTADDPAIRASLAEALDLSPELARALPPAYLVDSASDAARLSAEVPGAAFISRERLWARGGLLYVQGGEAAPGVLARESELSSIADEIPDTEARLEKARTTLRRLVEERTALAGRIESLNARAGELKRELAVAQARKHDVEKRRQKVSAAHQTIADEQAELESALADANAQRTEFQSQLLEKEATHKELEAAFDRAKADVDVAKETRQGIETENAGRRGHLALLEERLSTQIQEVARVRRQITYTEEQLRIWSQEDGTLRRRLGELGGERENAEGELQGALERRAGAEEEVLAAQKRLDEERESIRGLEEQVKTTRAERETVRRSLEGQRVEQASANQDAEHLAASYRETFGRLIPGTAPPPPPEISGEQALLAGAEAESLDAGVEEHVPAHLRPSARLEDEAEEHAEGEEPDGGPDAEAADGEESDGGADGGEVPAGPVEDDVELPENVSAAELAESEGELGRVKAVLERLGPVNVLAAKEYEEQEERREFLHAQRRDVASSVESLKVTIAEINELSAQRFRETFDEVNRVFGETFIRLFRGGEAYMSLFDEEDLLETGIEITARPPGKRPQNISLLSGGEKALTAIALLFALFQTKPSPFCILDEVDAPLDDANVLRFVETLNEMAQDTQFLVVTHNKLTMEVAQTLYGVTMEEKGVSKLVQAQLDDLHPSAFAAKGSDDGQAVITA
ncbi:MAG: AAA family ATPase, partial [Acidobacteriota bacterium]